MTLLNKFKKWNMKVLVILALNNPSGANMPLNQQSKPILQYRLFGFFPWRQLCSLLLMFILLLFFFFVSNWRNVLLVTWTHDDGVFIQPNTYAGHWWCIVTKFLAEISGFYYYYYYYYYYFTPEPEEHVIYCIFIQTSSKREKCGGKI